MQPMQGSMWRRRAVGVVLTAFALPASSARADFGDQIAKLLADDGEFGDFFGRSVAISGSIAIVGAPHDGEYGEWRGSAYLFDVTTGEQITKLLPDEGHPYEDFGVSVAISGSTAIVGAYDTRNNSDSPGSAYLFDISTGEQMARLLSDDRQDDDVFGFSVAISGSTAIVGAPGDDDHGFSSGSAYVFDVATGVQILKLLPDFYAEGDGFGRSVAISGSTAIVGADFDDYNGEDSGSAYLFDVTTGEQIAKLRGGAAGVYFGVSVAVSGNTAIVGAPGSSTYGSARLFDVTTGDQIAVLLPYPSNNEDRFGGSVAISGGTAVVGASWAWEAGEGSGYAYAFDATTGDRLGVLRSEDLAEGDRFGVSVAISGCTAIVGAHRDVNENGFAGSAYLFDATADTICVPDQYDTIQEAIGAAEDGDEICVAPGTYNETIDFLGKAVRLYSTDGPEVTVIDATGLDASVVTCVSGEGPETALEGFTITGGDAVHGGGMHIHASSPTVMNCTFDGNRAEASGGGMYNSGGSPVVTVCTFTRNDAEFGGGMANYGNSNPALIHCTFTENTADDGGGILNDESDPTVTACTFSGNEADAGGGMLNNNSRPTVTDCTFVGNAAGEDGGGMANVNGSSPTVTNCAFTENTSSSGTGGGMMNYTGNASVTHCTFVRNEALAGGGMYDESDLIVVNCTFIGNAADNGEGGGMLLVDSSATITNCAFLANTAGNGRAVACELISSTVRIDNSILWNGGDEVYNGDESTIVITYSAVHGGYEGVGNIDADPLLDEDGRPQAGSPCIDAADNDAVPEGITEDLDGNSRFVDDPDTDDTGNGEPPIVDMGAYEFQGCPGDLDGNGTVDFADLVLILGAWGNEGGREDLDASGTVDFGDLLIVLDSWGPCE